MNKVIFEQEDNSTDCNSIDDCSKYNVNPQFDLNFYIQNAKSRFVTGSSIFEDENQMDEVSEDSDEGPRSKKKKRLLEEAKKSSGKWKRGEKDEEDMDNEDGQMEDVYSGIPGMPGKKGKQDKPKFENNHNPKVVVDTSNKIKEFCTEEFGIFERGIYVRMDIRKIKKKHVDHFNVNYPLVLCTTNIQESNFGFLKVRFNKHIFHPKILKNNDPIIFSMGNI